MADNCALPKMAGRLNFPYQAIAFFEIVSSTLIKKGITATLKTLWHLLISRAGSWYFFTFSTSVVRIFSFPGTAMSISVHSCKYVFMYNSRIWTIVLQLLVHKDSHIPSYPHFSILCNWQGWWSYHLLVHCNPYFLHSSQCTRRATILWPSPHSFWASIHWQYVMDSLHNLYSSVSDVLSTLCLTEFVLNAYYRLLLFSKLVIFIKSALMFDTVPESFFHDIFTFIITCNKHSMLVLTFGANVFQNSWKISFRRYGKVENFSFKLASNFYYTVSPVISSCNAQEVEYIT